MVNSTTEKKSRKQILVHKHYIIKSVAQFALVIKKKMFELNQLEGNRTRE